MFLAHQLVGFQSSTLRVNVTRQEGPYVWVTTADLSDVGTKLVLNASQVQEVPEYVEAGAVYGSGLVPFAWENF